MDVAYVAFLILAAVFVAMLIGVRLGQSLLAIKGSSDEKSVGLMRPAVVRVRQSIASGKPLRQGCVGDCVRGIAMDDRAEKLRQCIALYERYLREGVSGDLAVIYYAEIAAAKAMLDEIEPNGST